MTAQSRRRTSGERGETLAEIVVTVAIVGLAVVALVGALATGIAASAGHRQRSSADTVARSVAEALKDRDVALDPNGSYPSSIWSPTVQTAGFDVTTDASCLKNGDVDAVAIGEGNFGSCGGATTGLQRIVVTVTSQGS